MTPHSKGKRTTHRRRPPARDGWAVVISSEDVYWSFEISSKHVYQGFLGLVFLLVGTILFLLVDSDSVRGPAQGGGVIELDYRGQTAKAELEDLARLAELSFAKQREIHAALQSAEFVHEHTPENPIATLADMRRRSSDVAITEFVKARIRRNQDYIAANLTYADGYQEAIRPVPHGWPLAMPRLTLTSGFGQRRKQFFDPWSGQEFHKGLDLGARIGDPIVATAEGVVKWAAWDSEGYGNKVIIVHPSGYETLYAHMSSIHVKANQYVKPGLLIGRVGITGFTTGPHLHYEVIRSGQPLDPMQFLVP
ncbi:MAG: M23 family metallopeptidase [Spirochaetia bacterium]|nr:M23 family metallopeptidase [Spirochaetia bacterium]